MSIKRSKAVFAIFSSLFFLQAHAQGLLFKNTNGSVDAIYTKNVSGIVVSDDYQSLKLILKSGEEKAFSKTEMQSMETISFKESVNAMTVTTGTAVNITTNSVTIKQNETNFRINLSSVFRVVVVYGKQTTALDPELGMIRYKDITEGSCDIDLNGLDSNTLYYYQTCVFFNGLFLKGNVKSFTTAEASSGDLTCPDSNHPHMIDLGLPSGTKWACCNVGASKPEEYGGYYAWGETSEKNMYNWSTYKWCNGSDKTLTKYNTNSNKGIVDNKKTLDLSDDVAYVKWGSSWRIPTYEQCKELKEKCTYNYTTLNGVKGNVINGPNGKAIFIPSAGCFFDDRLVNQNYGQYRSSTLYDSFPACAWIMDSASRGIGLEGMTPDRASGLSVRPVKK